MKKIVFIIVFMLIISSSFISLGSTQSNGIMISNKELNRDVEKNIQKKVSFSKHIIDDNFKRVSGLYACDIDNDGDNDIVGSALGQGEIAWWRNDGGNPIIWSKKIISSYYASSIYVYASDIDGDTDIDIIATSASFMGEIAWWENDGNINPSWIKHTITKQFGMAHGIFAIDLDQDGDTDIIGTSAASDKICWWENNGLYGNGSSWTEHVIDDSFPVTQSVYSSDIDNDNLPDIISTSYDNNEVAWWHNNGGNPCTFTKNSISNNFNGAHWVYVIDVDGDSNKDILAAGASNSQIAWWKNPGINVFQKWDKQVIVKGFYGALSVHGADLDNDGDIDVFGTANGDDEVTWWENNGGIPITWISHILDNNFDGAWPIYSCDIENDGDQDIIAGADTDNIIALWVNLLYNKPNKPETPIGPNSGKINEELTFKTMSIDPDGDRLYYLFDWGDGNNSGWIGPYSSGEECIFSYIWKKEGQYQIKAKAKDINNAESEWSDPLRVNMPKNMNIYKHIFTNCYIIASGKIDFIFQLFDTPVGFERRYISYLTINFLEPKIEVTIYSEKNDKLIWKNPYNNCECSLLLVGFRGFYNNKYSTNENLYISLNGKTTFVFIKYEKREVI